MQETYLKAFQKLDQFRGDSAFTTWLIRIGIHEALHRIRIKKRETKTMEGPSDNLYVYKLIPIDNLNPKNKAIQTETRLMLETTINELPLKYRTVYILKEVEGMKNPAIVIILNCSEGNVKLRIHRAKKLLKEQLLKMSSSTDLFEFGNSRCDRMVNGLWLGFSFTGQIY